MAAQGEAFLHLEFFSESSSAFHCLADGHRPWGVMGLPLLGARWGDMSCEASPHPDASNWCSFCYFSSTEELKCPNPESRHLPASYCSHPSSPSAQCACSAMHKAPASARFGSTCHNALLTRPAQTHHNAPAHHAGCQWPGPGWAAGSNVKEEC